jgi:hypothetical protein
MFAPFEFAIEFVEYDVRLKRREWSTLRCPFFRRTHQPVHAPPPDLPPGPLMDVGFAILCSLVRHRRPQIEFLSIGSRVCSALLSDLHLAVRPLRFTNPSPPTVWVGDFAPPSFRTCSAHIERPTRKSARGPGTDFFDAAVRRGGLGGRRREANLPTSW